MFTSTRKLQRCISHIIHSTGWIAALAWFCRFSEELWFLLQKNMVLKPSVFFETRKILRRNKLLFVKWVAQQIRRANPANGWPFYAHPRALCLHESVEDQSSSSHRFWACFSIFGEPQQGHNFHGRSNPLDYRQGFTIWCKVARSWQHSLQRSEPQRDVV